jgi:hypothetical protein
VGGAVLVLVQVVEEVEQFLVDALGLAGAGEGLFEVLLGEDCGHGGQGLGFAEDGREELSHALGCDFALLGEVGEHFVHFVIGHKELFKYTHPPYPNTIPSALAVSVPYQSDSTLILRGCFW